MDSDSTQSYYPNRAHEQRILNSIAERLSMEKMRVEFVFDTFCLHTMNMEDCQYVPNMGEFAVFSGKTYQVACVTFNYDTNKVIINLELL